MHVNNYVTLIFQAWFPLMIGEKLTLSHLLALLVNQKYVLFVVNILQNNERNKGKGYVGIFRKHYGRN